MDHTQCNIWVWTCNAYCFSARNFLLLKKSRVASDFDLSMGACFVRRSLA
jgi:hypothetical protein